jgi:hypothetical protein
MHGSIHGIKEVLFGSVVRNGPQSGVEAIEVLIRQSRPSPASASARVLIEFLVHLANIV